MKIVTGITKVELTKDEIEVIRKAGKIFSDIYHHKEISLNLCDNIAIGKATFEFYGVDELACTLLSIVE